MGTPKKNKEGRQAKKADRIHIIVDASGGVINCISANAKNVDVTILDWDEHRYVKDSAERRDPEKADYDPDEKLLKDWFKDHNVTVADIIDQDLKGVEVDMPSPRWDDPWNNEFRGTIVKCTAKTGLVTVKDQDDDHFQIEWYRLPTDLWEGYGE